MFCKTTFLQMNFIKYNQFCLFHILLNLQSLFRAVLYEHRRVLNFEGYF